MLRKAAAECAGIKRKFDDRASYNVPSTQCFSGDGVLVVVCGMVDVVGRCAPPCGGSAWRGDWWSRLWGNDGGGLRAVHSTPTDGDDSTH